MARFGSFELDGAQRQLRRDGGDVHLTPKAFDLLTLLIEAAPRVVRKTEIHERLWPSSFVADATLTGLIKELRRALDDRDPQKPLIRTAHRVGYAFCAALEPEAESAPTAAAEAAKPVQAEPLRGFPKTAAAAVAVAAIAAIAFALPRIPGRSADVVARFEVAAPADAPLVVRSYTRDIAISRDGKLLAYCSADASLVIRPLDRLEGTRLTRLGPEIANPMFSPDGRSVAFLAGAALKIVPVGGGPVTTVAEVGEYTDRGAAWLDDGTIVIASTRGLLRVPAGGGEPEILAIPDSTHGEKAFGTAAPLPGGRAVLFTVRPARPESGIQIAAFDLTTRTRKDLLAGGTQPFYSPTGHLVYAADDATLRAVPFDAERLEIRGEPKTVVRGVMANTNGLVNYAVADNGTLVYVPGVMPASPRLAWVDRSGREELLPAPAMNYAYARLSPDGKRVALDVREPDADVWIWDLEHERLTRLTFNAAENPLVVWSPDGRMLAFGDGRSGTANVYWQTVGGGEIERLTTSPRRQVPMAFTRDGSRLVFGEAQPNGGWDLFTVTLDASRRVEPLLRSEYSEMNPAFSPDGRWLAYSSDESGRVEVYVRPFPDVSHARWQVSANGGSKPLWSRDGKEIFFLSPNRELMSAAVSFDAELAAGPITRLFDASAYTIPEHGSGGRTYDLSADGRRFLMLRRPDAHDDPLRAPRLVVVVNWFEDLRRLAAAD
ncbi:MAG TPA: winged helix-turn-helix domain-containing protein [Gammaproteobacteria bacterium]|nr:winged helix-turn-helix domain-containing protein [Gammaproteobacteria bacterium]